jgi:transposase
VARPEVALVSLRPQHPVPPVPDDTARVARAAFPRGNPYVRLRDGLGAVFDDAGFADLYPALGQPAYAPWRLALVTLLQFREGLSDRQAAEAVRGRIDWKYLLALDLADAGFDHSVLCEFRGRLLRREAGERLLGGVLDTARELGVLKPRGRQRTDSTHVLAAVRDLNRLELVAETLRAALNTIAAAAPDWLRALAPPEWHERYSRRIEDARLPEAGARREAYARQVGGDGYRLLDALDGPEAPPGLRELPAVAVLRRVWARHFERIDEGGPGGGTGASARLRPVQGRGPGDRVESPYDVDARFRAKGGVAWTGYMVHLTETCDDGMPRLVVHADTTPANVHEAMRTGPIHLALVGKGLAPAEHLVDAGYVSAGHLTARRARALRHRPRRPAAARRELAGPDGGRLQRRGLRGRLGAPARALPGKAHERELERVRGQGTRAPRQDRLQPGRPARPARPGRDARGPRGEAGSWCCTRARSTRRSRPPGREG